MQRNPKTVAASLIAIALSATSVAACGNSGGGGSGSGSTLSIAIGGDPSGLDPQLYEDQNALDVYANISEPLIFRDAKTNALEPGLATSWKQVDDHTLEVKLRSGIKFSDGEPFDAAAAAYSLNRITNKKLATQQSDYYGAINGAKAVDSSTLDVTASQPDATMPQSLSLVMIVPPKYIQQHGAKYFNAHPIGTGPYVFDSWSRGSQLTLKANTSYWGTEPSIKSIKFLVLPDPSSQLNALKTGQVDIAPSLSPQQLAQAPKKATIVGANHPMIILNQRSGPFANKDIRLAANYAIDRDTMASKTFAGFASVATCQPFGSQTLGYDPSLKPYPYDPDKAKQLLAAAGQPHPSVTFIGESGRWIDDLPAEQAVQGYLEAVGFKVKFQSLPFANFLQQLIPSGNSPKMSRPDMLFTSTGDITGDADQKIQTFYAENAPAGSLNDPTMYQLVDKEATTIDRDQRTTAQQAVLQRACDDADFIYLVAQQDLYGITKRVTWQPRYDETILVSEVKLS